MNKAIANHNQTLIFTKNDFKEDFVNAISLDLKQWCWSCYYGLAGAGTELVLYLVPRFWIEPQSAEEQRLFKYACWALL